MTSVSLHAVEIFQIRASNFCRRKQSYRVANRAQRGIDGLGEQMNFNRLALAGNDQGIFPVGNQILRAFGNPF